jgi:hypothetical protein
MAYRDLHKTDYADGEFCVPPAPVLERIIETVFFASMAQEEGRTEPVGIVFVQGFERTFRSSRFWNVMHIRSPRVFTVSEVTKLAAICTFPESLLTVIQSAGVLKVIGTARPTSAEGIGLDTLIRVLAPRPGTIAVCRGNAQIVRYERGYIVDPPPNYLSSGQNQEQLASIAQTVFGKRRRSPVSHHAKVVFDELSRIIVGMCRLAHGGLLAVLGPEDDPEPLLRDAHVLADPISVRQVVTVRQSLREYLSKQDGRLRRKLTGQDLNLYLEKEENRLEGLFFRLTRKRSNHIIQQIVRLSAIDGAVLLSHSLDVLAFGVKLPTPHDSSPEVFSVTDTGKLGPRWPIEVRGTRHRAAAHFAKDHPKGFALIVSQDGDAAVFQSVASQILYWPLAI